MILVICRKGEAAMGKGQKGASRILAVFCFLTWMVDIFLKATFFVYTFLCTLYFTIIPQKE